MKRIHAKIQAVDGVPLLMNTWYGIDPKNEIVQALKELRGIPTKRRTAEWYDKVTKYDWLLSLYYDPEMGPFMPAENIEGSLGGGAKKNRLGRAFKASVMVEPARIALSYDGPRDVEALYADSRFVDRRPCQAGSMKARPCFYEWNMEFDILYDETALDKSDIKAALEAASIWGLGSYRPKFGKFDIVSFKEVS